MASLQLAPQPLSLFQRCKESIDKALMNPIYEIFMTLLTFMVLYADDFRYLALKLEHDLAYYYFMLACFFLFFLEILVLSIVRPGYFLTFFFWMDVLSTFSTVMEVPMVMNDLLGIEMFSASKSTQLAKAGKASRVSSRATKIIRVVRLIRLIRIAKLYKYAYKSLEENLASQFKEQTERQKSFQRQSVFDRKQSFDCVEDVNYQQDIQRYNSKQIPLPKQPIFSDAKNSQRLNEIAESTRKAILEGNHSVIKIDISSNDKKKNQTQQLVQFADKPILYEQQNNSQMSEEIIIKNDDDDTDSKQQNQLVQEGVAISQDQETKVGKMLSELTTKRAIMVMFSVMISIPLLEYNTYFQDKSAYETGLLFLEHATQYLTPSELFLQNLSTDTNPIYFLEVKNITYRNDTIYEQFRDQEMNTFTTDTGLSQLIVGNYDESQLNAILGLVRTTFVIVVLVLGAILFSKDANDLIVTPIENMLAKVRRISDNPLAAARIEEDLAIAEEQLQKNQLDEKLKKNKLQEQGFETVILEKLIVKTGALLAIGFGEAGAEIIGENMKQDGDINPMIPGRKIFAILGFCDIRYFTDITEVLEERVMMFVNEIAEIVHTTVNSFEGAINKNIGEAFLMVWKFPPDVLKMEKDYPDILNLRLVNNLTDMALLAMIKIFIQVRQSQNIRNFTDDPEIQKQIPNCSIKMGYGLHVGWAIEGAIGSNFKIDASYLSPNVNMSARLEAATKQYGIYHLVSGPFYRLLSHVAQSRMRHIDRVTVKGSIQPVDFFTFDFDIKAVNEQVKEKEEKLKNKKIIRFMNRQKYLKRMENIRKERYHINGLFEQDQQIINVQQKYTQVDYMKLLSWIQFYQIFHEGVNSYLQGRWQYAKSCLEKTKTMLIKDEDTGFDGPSCTLLNYMNRFNYQVPEDWRGYRELTEK